MSQKEKQTYAQLSIDRDWQLYSNEVKKVIAAMKQSGSEDTRFIENGDIRQLLDLTVPLLQVEKILQKVYPPSYREAYIVVRNGLVLRSVFGESGFRPVLRALVTKMNLEGFLVPDEMRARAESEFTEPLWDEYRPEDEGRKFRTNPHMPPSTTRHSLKYSGTLGLRDEE